MQGRFLYFYLQPLGNFKWNYLSFCATQELIQHSMVPFSLRLDLYIHRSPYLSLELSIEVYPYLFRCQVCWALQLRNSIILIYDISS